MRIDGGRRPETLTPAEFASIERNIAEGAKESPDPT